MTNNLELLLDLDGVFADFEGGVQKLSGKRISDMHKSEMWKTVHRDKEFFLNLERLEEGIVLWNYIVEAQQAYKFPIKFLTGAPSSHAFREQKKAWVAKHKGEHYETIVLPRKDKQLYAGPGKILIDDNQENIDQWVAKEGIGLFYDGKSTVTISRLKELFDEN
jgi:hypothetical protein